METGGYDPIHSELFDDSDKAYQPTYVSPEPLEDSISDVLSDDDDLDTGYANEGIHGIRSENTKWSPQNSFRGSRTPLSVMTAASLHDGEYAVQSLLDANTPAYAPSHTYGSPSASPNGSSISGYPSPLSSIQPSVRAKEESDRYYRHPIKAEARDEPESDEYDPEYQADVSAPIELTHRPPSPLPDNTEASSYFPVEPNEYLFDVFHDGDLDDNRLNEDFEGFERDEQPESQVDGIIADIFGESDAEEEFEGFAENEIDKELNLEPIVQQPSEIATTKPTTQSGDESNHEEDDRGGEFVSDFDRIMERKRKELSRRRRRNRDIEFLNDSDDFILSVISRMRQAAEEDRQLLSENRPATRKLKMVSEVGNLLKRADLKAALVENGMLSAITDWLAPLPGHTLPNMVIRDTMMKCLLEFQNISTEVLQDSGIGKALMYLYKHPLETRENKDRAGRIINEWLRPIFNLTSDYRTLTKEERKQLDYEHLPKRRNIDKETYDHRDINRELDGEGKGLLRPGDPGWVGRARVPQPSNKDYIVRPKWRVGGKSHSVMPNDDEDPEGGDEDESQSVYRRRRKHGAAGGFGATSRIETHIRNLTTAARHRSAKAARAVTMSVEGRKLTL